MYIVGMIMPNFKDSKLLIFAPIAGISDSPTRKIAREMGADMTISELISAEGIIRNCGKTLQLAQFENPERPFGIQIFGANPDSMARAAAIMEQLNPDFIDINFGCPVRKVVEKNGGSSVLRDLKLMSSIVESVVKAVSLPVTVKMRSGWDHDSLVFLDAGKIIEDCGAAAVTLHPRTRSQGFAGDADWSQIKMLKETLTIPVIGNGDIFKPEDARAMLEQTGCDAVMIGRGAIGNPWIFARTRRLLESGEAKSEPTVRERIDLALRHFDATLEYYGVPRGIYIMRSRFAWYVKGLPDATKLRARLNLLISPEAIRQLMFQFANGTISDWNDSDKSATAESSYI